MLERLVADIGDDDLVNRLTSGLGTIESAEPPVDLWRLGRLVASSPELSAACDQGTEDLLERLAAMPDAIAGEFLAGFLLSRTLLALPPPVAILGFGMLAFGVPVHGSWLALCGMVLLGALTFAGLGLLVASRTRTTESVSGLINLVTMPMWLLGGIFFSNQRFPGVLQPVVQAMPMTHFTDGVRGIMLGSSGPAEVALSALVLLAIGSVSFVAAIRLFRWS